MHAIKLKQNSRLQAAQILTKFKPAKANLSALLSKELNSDRNISDKGFVRFLVWGVVRHLNTLDWFANKLLNNPQKTPKLLKNIILVGLSQLIYASQRVAPYAAIFESVEAAKIGVSETSGKLVNALLRKYLREKDTIKLPDDALLKASIEYSFPEWLIERWFERFSKEEAIKLINACNISPDLTLRINQHKSTPEFVLQELNSQGYNATLCKYSPYGLNVEKPPELASITGIDQKNIFVQDEASQLVCLLLQANDSDFIVDVCCGSGTKSIFLSQLSKAKIIAIDSSAQKIAKARETAKIVLANNIEFKIADALSVEIQNADKVLLDAPCSGLGTLRRKPDIKWNKTQDDIIVKFPKLQKELIESAAKMLKVGGQLLYVTCSTEPEENEAVVSHFLNKNKNFVVQNIGENKMFAQFVTKEGYFRSYPHIHNMDGFFAASLRRVL
ncbi:MAG: 16S rRNA (cytosine(967)-C(5))-methyltransferase RsmB [Endomicrobiales bacterium]|nr:16S rRNA (cytosine(967)-C(5))-methyltransferase RsmB [Endomicrobiales bacterium]